MELQLTITVALIAAASCYWAWRGWRFWHGPGKNCAGGCSRAATSTSLPNQQQIVAISLDKLAFWQSTSGFPAGDTKPE